MLQNVANEFANPILKGGSTKFHAGTLNFTPTNIPVFGFEAACVAERGWTFGASFGLAGFVPGLPGAFPTCISIVEEPRKNFLSIWAILFAS